MAEQFKPVETPGLGVVGHLLSAGPGGALVFRVYNRDRHGNHVVGADGQSPDFVDYELSIDDLLIEIAANSTLIQTGNLTGRIELDAA